MRQASTWFAISFVAYFVLHTVYALPHYALGPELTLDYHERTRLFGYREAFAILGTVTRALREAGVSEEEVDTFHAEAMAGDYDHLIQTCMTWVEVS